MTNQFGPVIGQYRGDDIHEWFSDKSGRFQYARIAAEDRNGCISLDQLGANEVVIAPGLIYRREVNGS